MAKSKEPKPSTIDPNLAFLQSVSGLNITKRESSTSTTHDPENEEANKTGESNFVGIKEFRTRMFGTQSEYESLVQEVFVRTVDTMQSRFTDRKKYPQLIKYFNGETEGAKLLRKISLLRVDGEYNKIQEADLDLFVKILNNPKYDEFQKFPIEIAKDLETAISRLSVLDKNRALIEQAPELELEIARQKKELDIKKVMTFDAQQAAEKAQFEAKKILSEVSSTNDALLELQELRAKIPIDRRNLPNVVLENKTELVEKPTITIIPESQAIIIVPVETPEDIQRKASLREQHEAEYQRLVEIDQIKNAKIERLLAEVTSGLEVYTLSMLIDFQSEIIVAQSKTSSKQTPIAVQKLTGIKKFDDFEMKDLVLGKLSSLVQESIQKLKNTIKKEYLSEVIEIENKRTIHFEPCFIASNGVKAIIEKNDPNLSNQINRIEGFVMVVNELYKILKAKSTDKEPDTYSVFLTTIKNENSTDILNIKERDEFMKSVDRINFKIGWFKDESGGNYIINGVKMDSRIDLNGDQECRLYMQNDDGKFILYAKDSALSHA